MIFNTRLDRVLRTTRLVRRVIIDSDLPAGWPVKWGEQWDIAINNELIPTGLKSLDWTGQQWIEFITKQLNNGNKKESCESKERGN